MWALCSEILCFIDQWSYDAERVLSFSLPFCLWHRHCMVCFLTRLRTHTLAKEKKKPRTTCALSSQAAHNHAKAQHQCHTTGGKKEKATSCLNVFKMLCFSLLLFCSFSLFSCTLSLILALESGKKRVVVVVVVVGNISCEWRPSLVSPWTAV